MSSIAYDWLLAQSAATVIAVTAWILERRERRISQKRNEELSDACIHLVRQHSDERVKREEYHMLSFDSAMRNILDTLERAASNKPPK